MLDKVADAAYLRSQLSGIPVGVDQTHLVVLSKALDSRFQLATVSQANVDITIAAGTLMIPYSVGTRPMMPEIIGQHCADYWARAIAPGSAQSLSMISSVVNDAAKIAAPIALNLRAVVGVQTGLPAYEDFLNAIYKEVLTIQWQVVETTPPVKSTLITTVT